MSRLLRRLRRDTRGATIVEFAIVVPVMSLMLCGAFDTAHTLYMRAAVNGIMQKTARDSALESGAEAGASDLQDNKVRKQIWALRNGATVNFTRRYYRTFAAANAKTPEPWTDSDNDKICDHGEVYQDTNGNNVWDADGGDDGQGTAKDKTIYTAYVTYTRLLPMARLIGLSNTVNLTVATVLQNQPYGDQGSYSTAVVSRTCS